MYWLIYALMAIIFSAGAATGTTESPNRPAESGKSVDRTVYSTNGPKSGTERFEQVYSLNLNGRVKASNISGDIKVTTWDSPQLRLVAIKKSDDPRLLKEIELQIESTPESFSVKVKYPNQERDDSEKWEDHGRMDIEYELTVPRTAVLDKITSVSGDISIDGAENETNASSVSGDVTGSGLGGTAKLSSVSGGVVADFSNVISGSDIRLSSVSGSVNLKLPSYAGAVVKASTVSGKITNDFGLVVDEGKYVGNSMNGTFGDGSVNVKMSSVSGRINVEKQ